jgi:hypothetical protein
MLGLSPPARQWRLGNLIVLPACLVMLALIDPVSASAWIPLPTSCGAMTGLPCLFCGITRALHYLLHGDVTRAVYYNWLSIPLLVGVFLLLVCNALELALQINLLSRLPRPPSTVRAWTGYLSTLVLLWFLQVYLAVSQHKSELLNPHGPLYSLVVGDKQ